MWKAILDRREVSEGSVFSSGVEWESGFWASRSPVQHREKGLTSKRVKDYCCRVKDVLFFFHKMLAHKKRANQISVVH